MTSHSSMVSKSCVPADSPIVDLSPKPVGEWQTRAHVSMLLFRNAARTIFCIRYVSSFVHRDDEIAPIEPIPYAAWMRLSSDAA